MSGREALRWYVRRLRSMGPAEVAWRARRSAAGRAERVLHRHEPDDRRLLGDEPDWPALLDGFRASHGRPLLMSRERLELAGRRDPAAVEAVLAAARRARERRFRYFGYPEVAFPDGVDWHSAGPGAAGSWPVKPAHRIDYRHLGPDPKWVWELNRLQHLTWMAQAWLLEGDPGMAEEALAQLDGWIAASPPGVGVSWHGGFEAGIRAISVALALQGLRDAPSLTPARYRAAVRALAAMAEAAWSHRSLHSSANNHLLGEMTGLLAVGVLVPELAGAARWRTRAARMLERESWRQVLADGAGAEQAFPYQVFSGDLLLIAAILRRSAWGTRSGPIESALVRSAGYLAGLLGDDDPEPRYGDDDDGFAVRLGAEERRDPRAHLGAVAALTGDPSARRAGRLGLDGVVLLGQEGVTRWDTVTPGAPAGSFVAPLGGLVVLRSARRRITMDVGPLGYLAIAAHGHADALSVTLAHAGREIVGDPGPASYFGHPGWRTAHRSTPAHATVTVDGEDQSQSGGPFLWVRHTEARLLDVDLAAGRAAGEHTGYSRLDDPVVHRRALHVASDDLLLVVDRLTSAGRHRASTAWPLAPDLDAEPAGAGFVIRAAGAPVARIAQCAWRMDLTPVAVRGDEATDLGWWSDRLEDRRPAWVVGGEAEGEAPIILCTAFWTGEVPAGEVSLAVEPHGAGAAVSWSAGGAGGDAVVHLGGSGVMGSM